MRKGSQFYFSQFWRLEEVSSKINIYIFAIDVLQDVLLYILGCGGGSFLLNPPPCKQEAKGGSDEAQDSIVLCMSNELLYLVPELHTHTCYLSTIFCQSSAKKKTVIFGI